MPAPTNSQILDAINKLQEKTEDNFDSIRKELSDDRKTSGEKFDKINERLAKNDQWVTGELLNQVKREKEEEKKDEAFKKLSERVTTWGGAIAGLAGLATAVSFIIGLYEAFKK